MSGESEFMDVYFLILLNNHQLFRDMLVEDQNSHFGDTESTGEDFEPIYDTDEEEEQHEEEEEEEDSTLSTTVMGKGTDQSIPSP